MPSTKTSRDAAKASNRDKRNLDRIAERSLPAIARKIKLATMRAYERGDDINVAIRTEFERMAALLTDAMVASHLTGRLRNVRRAASHLAKIKKAAGPYDESILFLKRRMALTDEDVMVLTEKYGIDAVQVTRTASAAVETKAQQAMQTIITEGQHVREASQTLRSALDASGLATDKPYLLETISRTQIQVSYSAGQWNANQDPVIDDMLWGYEYVSTGDDRVRPSHEALDGTRLPKDDPQWDSIFPPGGFNCRCDAIEIYKDEADLAKEVPPSAEGGPDAGWDFNPGKLYPDTVGPIA